MSKVKVTTELKQRISQGDIFKNVECIESVHESDGIIEINKIVFPRVLVLTQDCDLAQNYVESSNQNKRLISVLVAPLYNAAHVFAGTQLSEIGFAMASYSENKTDGKKMKQNETPRYHYFDFGDIGLVPSFADFKHYFSVHVMHLENIRESNFICSLSDLYREDVSQRFSSYLSRIGLPE